MAHENRVHQLEDIANQNPLTEGKYPALAAGATSTTSSQNGTTHLFPVPVTLKAQLGSPTALAIGAFATTLTTLSLTFMEWRGVTIKNVYIGNFFFVAGIGMVISAQWEIVLGNTFTYTVFSAYGFFFGGLGAILTPSFGVAESFGNDKVQMNNAMGYFMLMWAIWTLFFLIGALPLNLVFIGIFFSIHLAFLMIAAHYFATADGHLDTAIALKKTGGVFAFLAGLLGYYTVGHLMCQQSVGFSFPLGDTSHIFGRKEVKSEQ